MKPIDIKWLHLLVTVLIMVAIVLLTSSKHAITNLTTVTEWLVCGYVVYWFCEKWIK